MKEIIKYYPNMQIYLKRISLPTKSPMSSRNLNNHQIEFNSNIHLMEFGTVNLQIKVIGVLFSKKYAFDFIVF
jgi:hypothetical protein